MRLFTRQGVNHVLHLLLSIFLCGLWFPVWLIIAASSSGDAYFCTFCGYHNSPANLANPHLARQKMQARQAQALQPSYWQTTASPFLKKQYKESPFFFVFITVVFCMIVIASAALFVSLTKKTKEPDTIMVPAYRPPERTVKNSNVAKKEPPTTSKNTKPAVVIADYAYVYNDASATSGIDFMLSKDDHVNVIRQKGAWFYISYKDQTGWVHGNYIKYLK